MCFTCPTANTKSFTQTAGLQAPFSSKYCYIRPDDSPFQTEGFTRSEKYKIDINQAAHLDW